MNREPLHVLNLEADAEDHELIRRHGGASAHTLKWTRVGSRPEFEAALKGGGVDLILADHRIPGFDGLSALELAQALRPGVPYLIVSDSIGEDRAAECLRRGARDFVHKDRLDRLPGAIDRALQNEGERAPPEAEDRFREMAENIRDVFWVCAADTGRVLYVSPAYDSIWGKPPDALFTKATAWPDAVLDEDRPAVLKARSKLAAGVSYQVEYRILRPDLSVRWINDRGFPVPDKPGRTARTVGVAADITERKQLEADLLQAQKMELVGKLAGGIAHDFNNLLTIITGYVSMLLDKDTLPPSASEALKRVFTASRQATGLVRQLLIFSRKRTPRREVVDLNAEIELSTGLLRRLLGENVSIEFKPSPDSPRVSADVGMLEQVLMNLAVNARDAMSGGGRLSISVGRRPPGEGAPKARVGDFACLTVQDTGCGIAAPILPRIFEPFFTTKAEGRGTGLGLATAQDIVRRHDGWIEVETEVGVGSSFRIYLPLTGADVTSQPDAAHGLAPKPGKATILLVEDEVSVREFAAAVLQQDGYTVLQAKSGENALEVWKWHSAKIDLLLSDVVLPGEYSGPQLAAKLEAEKAALKIILTTGYSRDAVAPQAPGRPPQIVLSKPYTPRSLLHAVKEGLA